jgi:hypothetical protein
LVIYSKFWKQEKKLFFYFFALSGLPNILIFIKDSFRQEKLKFTIIFRVKAHLNKFQQNKLILQNQSFFKFKILNLDKYKNNTHRSNQKY